MKPADAKRKEHDIDLVCGYLPIVIGFTVADVSQCLLQSGGHGGGKIKEINITVC